MEHPLNLTSFLPAAIQHHYVHVIMLCIVTVVVFLLGLYVRTLNKEVPGKMQNVFEALVSSISNLAEDVMGKEGRPYLPVILGIGLYVAISNMMSLIPGFIPPTSNMNTTAAPAVLVFLLYNFIGIKKHGFGYIKHFLGPMPALAPFMLIIEIISHLARPLSLTMRLFGNIAGEDLVVVILFMLVPFLVPVPMFCLMIFTGILQAFVFMMLAMVYISGALEEAH